jgi:tetratricopeptide (TPR) repeat protein
MDHDVRLLFHELADLSPEDRERVLAERRIGPEVRREIESLLSFDSADLQSLTICVADAAGEVLDSDRGRDLGSCGPYRLVRPLGAGGMGAVYLAERTDGEIQQRVAVKLLHADGHRPDFRTRFLRERQILASLNHPSIVHVIDAGHTDDGRPYLVMEYVDGVPIDLHGATIPWRDRLSLFLRVCDGVAHAHRHLIIHRDLKPSNILVDAAGQPKLLDFGIAKLLDNTRDATQTVDRLLTPNYASPEQLSGTVQTTATDVFSLGAVLYKLLTGRSPREPGGALDAAASVVEIPHPSRLNPSLPSDLDYILRKALRPEPEERYASVEAFSNDIRAFLESKPVQARSGNAWYRTRKFLRRYWIPVTAAALVVASLSVGLYIANRERTLAQRRFLQVRQLANKVLELDSVLAVLPGSTKARTEIVAMSQGYLEALGAEARTDLDLALEVAGAYTLLARAQGVPTTANLGQYAAAAQSLKKADALLEPVLKAAPRNRKALLLSAEVAEDRMILSDQARQREEEVAQARKAAARANDLLALGTASASEIQIAARIFVNVALVHKNTHLYDDSIRYARRAVEIARSKPSNEAYVGNALSIIADSLRFSGDLEGALQAIQEARRNIERAIFSGETARRSNTFNVLWREGTILGQDGNMSLDRPAEAIAVLQKAFDLTEEWAQKDLNNASSRILEADAAREMGLILRHRDPWRSLAVYDLALRRIREVPNNVSARHNETLLLAGSSYVLRRVNRIAEAKDRIDTAFRLLREMKDYPADRIDSGGEADMALRALGDHLAETGQPQRAAEVYQELLDKITAYSPDPLKDLRHATKLSRTYESLAALNRRTGRANAAADLDARRLELWKGWDSQLPNNPFVHRQLEAALLP